ncbi:isoleucine tRS [Acrasis kona]|uniref:Isoleucine tRS n=1 Tax=Acrasis kona TaxID=1008807 RepID=A0AAW2ZBF6_9EUKA
MLRLFQRRQSHVVKRLYTTNANEVNLYKQYSSTLNLPSTAFLPWIKNPSQHDKDLQKICCDHVFKWNESKSKDTPTFILHDGPPYANGSLHIGHAMNKILKDTVNRYKLLKGFKIKMGLPRSPYRATMNPIEIRQKAKEFALQAVSAQREQFKTMGVFGDWENPYTTLSPEFEASQDQSTGVQVRKLHLRKANSNTTIITLATLLT